MPIEFEFLFVIISIVFSRKSQPVDCNKNPSSRFFSRTVDSRPLVYDFIPPYSKSFVFDNKLCNLDSYADLSTADCRRCTTIMIIQLTLEKNVPLNCFSQVCSKPSYSPPPHIRISPRFPAVWWPLTPSPWYYITLSPVFRCTVTAHILQPLREWRFEINCSPRMIWVSATHITLGEQLFFFMEWHRGHIHIFIFILIYYFPLLSSFFLSVFFSLSATPPLSSFLLGVSPFFG